MNEERKLTPLIIPVTVDGLRYWTKFEKAISKILWPSATANEALCLGVSLLICVVLTLGYSTFGGKIK